MRPLVFVHGFMGGSDQWAPQAPLGQSRELICVDLPGFGRNAEAAPISSIAGFARWVLDSLSARGVQSFDLLGHSMGGMIVQEMTAQAPDRVARLILYGTGPVGLMPGRFEPIEVSMQRARADGPDATARRIAATWFLHREAAPAYPGCAEMAARAGLPAILAGLEAIRDWSGEAQLAGISCPTRIIWGEHDRSYQFALVEKLWHGIEGCELAVMPGCAHAAHLENPDLFNLLVDGFV